MNAAQLFSGQDYAHTNYLRRGVNYYSNANRVRVLRVYQIEPNEWAGEKRKKTVVEVLLCNPDGTVKINEHDGSERTGEVRARDIFMRWDEYAVVHADREKEHLEREEKNRLEREERNRLYQERIERENKERAERIERERVEREAREAAELLAKERLYAALESQGIKRKWITSIYTTQIVLDRELIEAELGVVV